MPRGSASGDAAGLHGAICGSCSCRSRRRDEGPSMNPLVLRSVAVGEDAPAATRIPKRPIRAVVIQPPARECVKSLLPQVEEDGGEGIGFKPPLGILYCASTIKERSPHEILVIDAMAEQLDFEGVVRKVAAFNPEVVGISAWTDFWYP